MNFLKIENLSVSFGGIAALKNVELHVEKGEFRAIIGPNGAGKTTLFNVIAGFYKADEGKIFFEGEDITKLKTHKIVNRGILRTFQRSEMFSKMTVLENMMIGKHITLRAGLIGSAIKRKRVRLEEERKRMECCEMLEFLGLAKYKDALASSLPLGHRKILELGRALGGNPKLLLLDEPAAGMNLEEVKEFHKRIMQIRSWSDVTILMVEHNMRLVMEVAERISVLQYGEKIADGSPDEIRNNPKVIEAYLGNK